MSGTLEGLFHDAANLRRFIEYTNRLCEEDARHESYVGGSESFFKHTEELAKVTIAYLDALPIYADTDLRIRTERQKLVALKAYWRLVHRFIKPAADANTLRIPIPLVNLLSDLAKMVPRVSSPQILILISEELNYFQYRHTGLKDAYSQLRGVLPTATDFPDGLGFIGIPYSQGSSFFTNLVVFHELGHFVFEESASANPLHAPVDVLFADPFFSRLDVQSKAWSRELLLTWAEEIYCDLFAIRLIGPAYSFAFVELFGLMGTFEAGLMRQFGQSHPSNAFRFREHLAALSEAGWWDSVSNLNSEYVTLIQDLAAIPESEYEFVLDDGTVVPRTFIDSFLRLLPDIRNQVASAFPAEDSCPSFFADVNKNIQDCLAGGIVPSALFGNSERSLLCESLAIMNAGCCFYLASLPNLIDNIEDQRTDNIEHRSKWTKALEAWILKALDNVRLLHGEAGTQ